MNKGRLFVISGPSGTGKGTICKEIINTVDANLSVSMTTRAPRSDETEGENYFFVSKEHFLEVKKSDGFLEHAEVYESFYGTPKGPVLESLNKGEDVILEIDIQGALKVKKSFPQGVFIFILPPSMDELKNRLINRGTESEECIDLRLSKVIEELSYIEEYDYYVVNDNIDEAAVTVASIMKAEHARVGEHTKKIVNQIVDKK